MRNGNLAGIIGAALVIFALWALLLRAGELTGSTGRVIQLGSLSIDAPDAVDDLVTLINPTDGPTSGRFDSFDSPLGTDFQVPADRTLFIVGGDVPNDGAATAEYALGYGDDHVENSVAAPTNAVTVSRFTVTDAARELSLWVEIPAGKFPFVSFVSTAGPLDGNATFWAVLE